MMPDEMDQRRARLERLRRLGLHRGGAPGRSIGTGGAAPQPASATPAPQNYASAPARLPGEAVDTPFGQAWVCEERYPLSRYPALAEWLRTDPVCLAALDRNPALEGLDPATAAFVDTETTGLGLGAGTYTFLIGIGLFERPALTDPESPEGHGSLHSLLDPYAGWTFVVHQVFMRHPGEERAQLHIVEELLGRSTGIVSFNGRGFDMPLINNRFILNEMPPPMPAAPHLDLLPPARRLYRLRWGACNLGALERNVLRLERSAEDVPGYLIPDIYRQYYLTGEPSEMLARVFYHNLQDVASMALLGARMARCFRIDSLSILMQELHPLECLSLGRCYDALQWTEAEIVVYRAAADNAPEPAHQATALRELALLYKRLEQRDQAAQLWEECVSRVGSADLTPYIELAKHHEWHTGDLAAARGWAGWALNIAQSMAPGFERNQAVADLQRRMARIETKLTRGRSNSNGSED